MQLFKGLVNDVLAKIESRELDPHNEVALTHQLIGIRVGYGSGNRQLDNLKKSAVKKEKKKCC